QCRHVHQRHADDLQHGLRRMGREHHEREHCAQALHERHLGEPADRGGSPIRTGIVRRVLRQRNLLTATWNNRMSTVAPHTIDRTEKAAETRIAAYLLTEYLERLGVEVIFGLCGHTIIA